MRAQVHTMPSSRPRTVTVTAEITGAGTAMRGRALRSPGAAQEEGSRAETSGGAGHRWHIDRRERRGGGVPWGSQATSHPGNRWASTCSARRG